MSFRARAGTKLTAAALHSVEQGRTSAAACRRARRGGAATAETPCTRRSGGRSRASVPPSSDSASDLRV